MNTILIIAIIVMLINFIVNIFYFIYENKIIKMLEEKIDDFKHMYYIYDNIQKIYQQIKEIYKEIKRMREDDGK